MRLKVASTNSNVKSWSWEHLGRIFLGWGWGSLQWPALDDGFQTAALGSLIIDVFELGKRRWFSRSYIEYLSKGAILFSMLRFRLEFLPFFLIPKEASSAYLTHDSRVQLCEA
jgi:hypothetical protein